MNTPQLTRRNLIKVGAAAAASSLLRSTHAEHLTSAGDFAPEPPPNVLWIMADQLRKQALGFMHEDLVHTPNLDKLAREGATFRNAISNVPVCTPNRSCLFTGRYSVNTNMLTNNITLMPQFHTLGERAKAAGYDTAYFGKWHLGFHQEDGSSPAYIPPELRHGFDTWHASQGISSFLQPFFIDGAKDNVAQPGWAPDLLGKAACEYISKADHAKPFCMVVSFGPPHNQAPPDVDDRFMPKEHDYQQYLAWKKNGGKRSPRTFGYKAPQDDEKYYVKGGACYRRPVRPNAVDNSMIEESKCFQGYFGSVTAIDKAVGTLLAQIESSGLAKNTVVLFTADHGDMMGSHGMFEKDQFYQESAGIPLLVRWPGHIPARQYDQVVASIDFTPTLAELTGMDCTGMDGHSLAALLTGRHQDLREFAFGAYFQGSPVEGPRQFRSVYTKDLTYAVCDGPYCYRFGPEVMFDRRTDRYEMSPIKRGMGRDSELDRLQAVLRAELQRQGDPFFADIWDAQSRDRPASYKFYDNKIAEAMFPEQRTSM